jgi:His-Xaa-Ser system protein HxsD
VELDSGRVELCSKALEIDSTHVERCSKGLEWSSTRVEHCSTALECNSRQVELCSKALELDSARVECCSKPAELNSTHVERCSKALESSSVHVELHSTRLEWNATRISLKSLMIAPIVSLPTIDSTPLPPALAPSLSRGATLPPMSDPLEGLPPDLVSVEAAARAISLRVDASLYPLGALYGASYVFIDRCWVLLDRPDEKHFRVTLTWKKPDVPAAALEALAGEFMNELLSCAWRAKIAEESRSVIESVTARAYAGAMGPPSLDELESFEFSEEAFEDPLGIAMSWEEKYGKKKKDEEKKAGEPR